MSTYFPDIITSPLWTGRKSLAPVHSHKALIDQNNGNILAVISKYYTPIKHETLLDITRESLVKHHQEFGKWSEDVQTFHNGARMLARFRFDEIDHTVGGDLLHPEIILHSSYDMSKTVEYNFGAFRLVCENGLTIGELLMVAKERHMGNIESKVQSLVNNVLKDALDRYSERIQLWQQWVERITTPNDYERVMSQLDLGKRAQEEINQTVEISSNLTMEDIKLKTLSYWLFFNIICQYVTHRVASLNRRIELEARVRNAFKQ
jgi:hypothetical protein